MNGDDLARYLDESVDPAEAVAAMSESALAELADALYRQLDCPSPAFGTHSWYTQVTDELRLRRLTGAKPDAAEPKDHGPGGSAGREVPAG
ncbi:hypothetical protein [Arthrobacter pascens]|uniref:hypothetical protein n=1 Tax=Arthrobacter pascens TaxID=1677 RepID=UPI00196A5A29|nr:hypothetical protein [Arthrobacter pascens]MBN3496875.1 hypothetical protein [Arthrobacter pascens]